MMKRKRPQRGEIPPEVQTLFKNWGAQGGKATAQHRTPEERKAAAVKAIKTRWKRYREKKRSYGPRRYAPPQ